MISAKLILAAAFAGTVAAAAALANDTTAETAAGGLVFTHNPDIDMVSEDLLVSAERIRVAYVFRNRAAEDRTVTVAFPLPDRDLSQEQFSDVAFPSDFQTRVGGAPFATRIERKAMLGNVDHTATLAGFGVPLVETGDGPENRIGAALDRLPAEAKARLLSLRLVEAHQWDEGRGAEDHLLPLWTVKEAYYWEQSFPAGRDLAIEHSYVPGAGGSVGTGLLMPGFRDSEEGRRMISDYCIDADFLAGARRLGRQVGGDYPIVPEQRVAYILTTGANWRSPIASFRLVVDKGSPDNIVSFCGENLRRIGPTRFEMRRTNWRPDRDLRVLILRPPPPTM
jgi:hypothetical protein